MTLQTPDNYTSLIKKRLTWPKYSSCVFNELSAFGYDAVWALALMLNRSVERLETTPFDDGKKRKLEDFTYEDGNMTAIFLNLLNDTDFIGLTVCEILTY